MGKRVSAQKVRGAKMTLEALHKVWNEELVPASQAHDVQRAIDASERATNLLSTLDFKGLAELIDELMDGDKAA